MIKVEGVPIRIVWVPDLGDNDSKAQSVTDKCEIRIDSKYYGSPYARLLFLHELHHFAETWKGRDLEEDDIYALSGGVNEAIGHLIDWASIDPGLA